MAEEKRVVELNGFEYRLMVNGLSDFRNDLIRDQKPTEDVDDLLLITQHLSERCRMKSDAIHSIVRRVYAAEAECDRKA